MMEPHGNSDDVNAMFEELVSGLELGEDPHGEAAFITATGDGFLNELPRGARQALADIAVQVIMLAGVIPAPVAYEDDADQQAYALLAGAQLADEIVACAERCRKSAFAKHITEDDLEAWLRVLNKARMILTVDIADSEDMEQMWAEGGEQAEFLSLIGALQHEVLNALR